VADSYEHNNEHFHIELVSVNFFDLCLLCARYSIKQLT
jgi:hypothetical protein